LRKVLRPLCEGISPILTFVEEPDGQDKNYIIIESGKSDSLALCWGRYGDGEIRRCQTKRNKFIQEQGYLFPIEDGLVAAQITATLGYDIADDFTEGGIPCWWMQRLVLLRERYRESEFIKEVCFYEKPKKEDITIEDYVFEMHKKESREIERIADKIRKKIS